MSHHFSDGRIKLCNVVRRLGNMLNAKHKNTEINSISLPLINKIKKAKSPVDTASEKKRFEMA